MMNKFNPSEDLPTLIALAVYFLAGLLLGLTL